MGNKRRKFHYRIAGAVAVLATAGLGAICWWVTPTLEQAPIIVRIVVYGLIALVFSFIFLLIWMLCGTYQDD